MRAVPTPVPASRIIPQIAKALALGATLFAVALATRLMIFGTVDAGLGRNMLRLAYFTREDAIIIGTFSMFAFAAYMLAEWTGRGWRVSRWFVGGIYAILGMMMAGNVIAIRVIGGPVGKSLLAQADWFRSFTPISAIWSAMTFENLVLLGSAGAVLVLLPLALVPLISKCLKHKLSALALWTGLVILVAGYAQTDPIERPRRTVLRVANPTMSLANSLLKPPPMDILAIAPGAIPQGEMQSEISLNGAPPPTTIIVVMLESIGADAAYGESPVKQVRLMPNLEDIASKGIRFDEVYSPVSASTSAGVTVLSGKHPPYPPAIGVKDRARQTLASHLAEAGWNTAFFMSGDLAFQGFAPYLRERGFGKLEDMTARGCDTDLELDDRCTAQSLERWLDQTDGSRRFAVVWSGQAHYPYYDGDMQGSSPEELLARYERAVRYSDLMLADIVADLKQRGALDETLLVVTGDHGEAFDEHGFQLHANAAYVEEVRVPLVMRHPRLPAGLVVERTGSTVDIASTILSVLGDKEPFGQGVSLLGSGPDRPAFSSVIGTAPTLSWRMGKQTVLLHLDSGQVERFDRSADPFEQSPEVLLGAERERALAVFSSLARAGTAAAEK